MGIEKPHGSETRCRQYPLTALYKVAGIGTLGSYIVANLYSATLLGNSSINLLPLGAVPTYAVVLTRLPPHA